jgi:hypothetical protein
VKPPGTSRDLPSHPAGRGPGRADTAAALEEQRSEKYRHAQIAVVSIGVRAGQLGGTMPGSRPTWYLTHEYVGRDQTCDLQKLQVAPLTVPLFLEGLDSTSTSFSPRSEAKAARPPRLVPVCLAGGQQFLLDLGCASRTVWSACAAVHMAAARGVAHAVAQLRELVGADIGPVGFQNSATAPDLGFYAARSYSLMRPPRTGRRLIRSWERSATGWSGRGGRSWRLRCGRRPL